MRALRRTALALAAAVTVVVAGLLSMTELPAAGAAATPIRAQAAYAAAGPSGVGVREVLLPPGGGRTWVWYPTAAPPTTSATTYPYEITIAERLGPTTIGVSSGHAVRDARPDHTMGARPVVVLEPGYGIGPAAYAWLGEHLASHGFVVAATARTGSLAGAMTGLWRSAVDRPREFREFVEAIVTWSGSDDPLAGLVDTHTTAVVGHSYGGYTALAAGGARLDTRGFQHRCALARDGDRDGAWLCEALLPHLADMAGLAGLAEVPEGLWPDWRSPAVDAVVSLAGDAYLFDRAGLAELAVPMLAVGGTADVDTPFAWGTGPTFAHAGAPRGARAALRGADHMVFTARCTAVRRIVTLVPFGFCDDPGGLRGQRHQVVAHLTTAFLLAELTGDEAATQALAAGNVALPATSYDARGY